MPSSCVVGGCTHKVGQASKRPDRQFLIMHKAPRDKQIRQKWDVRVNRQPSHVCESKMTTYYVCSDHFHDSDYDPSDFNVMKLLGYEKRMKMRLKPEAIPNTHPDKDELQLYLNGQVHEGEVPSHPVRSKRARLTRRVLNEMDEFSSSIDTAAFPYTAPELQTDDLHAPSSSMESVEPPVIDAPEAVMEHDIVTATLSSEIINEPHSDSSDHWYPDLYESDFESDSDDGSASDGSDYDPDDDHQNGRGANSTFNLQQQGPRQKKDKRKSIGEFVWAMVSMNHLLQLFKWCPECGSKNTIVGSCVMGLCVKIQYRCSNRKTPHTGIWTSSPVSHKRYLINILFTSTLNLCGIGYSAIQAVMAAMKMPFINRSRFIDITKAWFNPVVYNYFIPIRDAAMAQLKARDTKILSGDGQFDSPGHCAKFCVYTIMDHTSGLIIDFFIAQKGLNFEELERAGCRELLKKIIAKGMSQFKFVTDRHSGIRAMIRDDITFSTVTHYFDIWHLAKSIGKILKELTKLKRNESLIPWKQSIINHFWFSCRNSAGDPQKLIQTFHSFLLHITNSHKWTTGTFSKMRGENIFPNFSQVVKCAHGKLQKIQLRRGAWIDRKSDTFSELFDKITNKQLSEDMMHCSEFLHTGSIENYHNVRLKYLPKRIAFSRETTAIRSMIAIIETNCNITQNTSSLQEPKMYVRYSKASAKWILRKRSKEKDYTYRGEILSKIEAHFSNGTLEFADMTEYVPKNTPKNIATIPKPSKEEMVKKYKARKRFE